MDDKPYTMPDEDPFNVRPLPTHQPRRRRSSMLDKWILEQQKLPDPQPDRCNVSNSPTSNGNQYLAYPDLGITHSARASMVTLGSFELVDDTDIPQDISPETPFQSLSPTTPNKGFLKTPSSFRSIQLSFRSQSPSRSITPTSGTPTTPSRKSFLPLNSRLGSSSERGVTRQHNRSASFPVLNSSSPSSPPSSPCVSESSPPPSKWRPSVLGYFSSSATSQVSFIPSETLYTPSRPSVSSNSTATTATTTTTTTTSATATAMEHGATKHIPSPSFNHGTATDPNALVVPPLPSKYSSLRAPLAHKAGMRLGNPDADDDLEDEESSAPPTIPKLNAKPEIAFSVSGKSGTLSKMTFPSLASRSSKKKRLVISGIAPDDVRKFEGVKHWCEGFGEVTHIVRMPNGDLHVHFRSADVADTVCRLRAKVYIVGCGSVGVSWTTGNKR